MMSHESPARDWLVARPNFPLAGSNMRLLVWWVCLDGPFGPLLLRIGPRNSPSLAWTAKQIGACAFFASHVSMKVKVKGFIHTIKCSTNGGHSSLFLSLNIRIRSHLLDGFLSRRQLCFGSYVPFEQPIFRRYRPL